MSLKLFMKSNQEKVENFKHPASSTLKDEKGKPLEWEFKGIETEESEQIMSDSLKRVSIPNKKGQYTTEVDIPKMRVETIVAATVFPNLNDAALQDSYEVKTPEALVVKMINKAAEYNKTYDVIAEKSNMTPLQDKVDEAKN